MSRAAVKAVDDDDIIVGLLPIDRSVKVATAAMILDCDESQVRKLVKSGQLEAHIVGKRGIRIRMSSIDGYRTRRAYSAEKQPTTTTMTTKRRQRRSVEDMKAIAALKQSGCL